MEVGAIPIHQGDRTLVEGERDLAPVGRPIRQGRDAIDMGDLAQLAPVRSDRKYLWPVITGVGLESNQAVPTRESGTNIRGKGEGGEGREDRGREGHGSTTCSVHGVLPSKAAEEVAGGRLSQGHAPIAPERRP